MIIIGIMTLLPKHSLMMVVVIVVVIVMDSDLE